jgi:hypothetical protein
LKDKDNQKIGESVFSKTSSYPVDSMVGKYNAFKNNTTGKNNIGINVNANLIYSILNKGEISLREHIEGFKFDGQEYRTFAGNKEFNLESGQFDGRRTNDIFSTNITSATDEAKEQLNALYNLGVDALKIVDYLVALHTPLKTAIYFVNQPAIQNYLQVKAVKQNTLQTQDEDKLSKDNFREEAMNKTNTLIKDYEKLSDAELLGMFEREGSFRKEC